MSEQTGPLPAKVQLHLRVQPEVAELIDACRGPATRNAYASMILERELSRRNDSAAAATRAAASAPGKPTVTVTEAELGPGIPWHEPPEADCHHPAARVIKGLCRACGTYVG
jgi:hypothetical protein